MCIYEEVWHESADLMLWLQVHHRGFKSAARATGRVIAESPSAETRIPRTAVLPIWPRECIPKQVVGFVLWLQVHHWGFWGAVDNAGRIHD